jgi:glycine oxidase
MTDCLIIGQGLAACTLAHVLHQHGLTFKLIGLPNLSSCSTVAAGIWNPVVFKRLTQSWMAEDLIDELLLFYSNVEKITKINLLTHRPIIRSFFEEQEINLWQKKSQNYLNGFLDKEIFTRKENEFSGALISSKYGKVLRAGNLNVTEFLKATLLFFKENAVEDFFDYSVLTTHSSHIQYKQFNAKNIIFCEGYLVKDNPYFNWVPLKPAKGETLDLKIINLNIDDVILNKDAYLMNTRENIFKLGATYNWEELNDVPTEKGQTELSQKLKYLINSPYEITNHQAGVRPASIDRRPIIGVHPDYKNLFVFNGLGAKGVMLAPYFAKNLVNFILQKNNILTEADVKRFYHLYKK